MSESPADLLGILRGHTVPRRLSNGRFMRVNVAAVTADRIYAGPWVFCRATGWELGRDGKPLKSNKTRLVPDAAAAPRPAGEGAQ